MRIYLGAMRAAEWHWNNSGFTVPTAGVKIGAMPVATWHCDLSLRIATDQNNKFAKISPVHPVLRFKIIFIFHE